MQLRSDIVYTCEVDVYSEDLVPDNMQLEEYKEERLVKAGTKVKIAGVVQDAAYVLIESEDGSDFNDEFSHIHIKLEIFERAFSLPVNKSVRIV
jgi:hypothetical protein